MYKNYHRQVIIFNSKSNHHRSLFDIFTNIILFNLFMRSACLLTINIILFLRLNTISPHY